MQRSLDSFIIIRYLFIYIIIIYICIENQTKKRIEANVNLSPNTFSLNCLCLDLKVIFRVFTTALNGAKKMLRGEPPQILSL
jgi:hypothetical protein